MRRLLLSAAAGVAVLVLGVSTSTADASTLAMRGTIPLVVDESLPGFDVPSPTLTVRRGIETFLVLVPATAGGPHGVGIDGGQYRNIKGAAVGPGLMTSLTVALNPGTYTIFDPQGANRAAGFRVKVRVLRAQAGRHEHRKACGNAYGVADLEAFVSRTTCGVAKGLGIRLDKAWRAQSFAWTPITALGFTCTFEPFTETGLKATCTKRNQRVTFTS